MDIWIYGKNFNDFTVLQNVYGILKSYRILTNGFTVLQGYKTFNDLTTLGIPLEFQMVIELWNDF